MADTKGSEAYYPTPIEVFRALKSARNISPALEPAPSHPATD